MKNNTITMSELKKILKESKRLVEEGPGAGYDIRIEDIHVNSLKVVEQPDSYELTMYVSFTGSAHGYDWESAPNEYDGIYEVELSKKLFNEVDIADIDKDSIYINSFDYSCGDGYSHVNFNSEVDLSVFAAVDTASNSKPYLELDSAIRDRAFTDTFPGRFSGDRNFELAVNSAYETRDDGDNDFDQDVINRIIINDYNN